MMIKLDISNFICSFWMSITNAILGFFELIINLIFRRKPHKSHKNHTDAYYNQNTMPPRIFPKSRLLALILCIICSTVGFHRYYVGRLPSAFLYMITFGFCGIGWIIDIFLIISGTFKDSNGLPLKQW